MTGETSSARERYTELERVAEFQDIYALYKDHLMPAVELLTRDEDLRKWGTLSRSQMIQDVNVDPVYYTIRTKPYVDKQRAGARCFEVSMSIDAMTRMSELAPDDRERLLVSLKEYVFGKDEVDEDMMDDEMREWWEKVHDPARAQDNEIVDSVQYEYIIDPAEGVALRGVRMTREINDQEVQEYFLGTDLDYSEEDRLELLREKDNLAELLHATGEVSVMHMRDIEIIKHALVQLGLSR